MPNLQSILWPRDRPSPIFVTYTLLLNIVPLVSGPIVGTLYWSNHCQKPLHLLEWILSGLALLFAVCGIRIYVTFSQPLSNAAVAEARTFSGGYLPESIGLVAARTLNVLLHDGAACVMISVLPIALGVLLWGAIWLSQSSAECEQTLRDWTIASLTLMGIFLAFSWMAVLVSTCMEVFSGGHKPDVDEEAALQDGSPTMSDHFDRQPPTEDSYVLPRPWWERVMRFAPQLEAYAVAPSTASEGNQEQPPTPEEATKSRYAASEPGLSAPLLEGQSADTQKPRAFQAKKVKKQGWLTRSKS